MAVFMDQAGIEPASESLSLKASPITAVLFLFPRTIGEQRPFALGSFIIRLPGQSLAGIVSRNHNAGDRLCGCRRADK